MILNTTVAQSTKIIGRIPMNQWTREMIIRVAAKDSLSTDEIPPRPTRFSDDQRGYSLYVKIGYYCSKSIHQF